MIITLAIVALSQGAASITLQDALSRARSARPQVAASVAAAAGGRAEGRLATVIPNPTLQFEADQLSPTRKLTVVQPLGWLTRRASDGATSRALAARGSADSARMIAELGLEVRRSFYTALATAEIVRLSIEQVAAADSLLAAADRRLAAGDIAAFERDQVAQDASLVRLHASRAQGAASVAHVELRRAIAWEDPAPILAAGALDAGVDDAPPGGVTSTATLPPLLRSALADSAAASARLRSARVAQWPIPGIVFGREWGGESSDGANAIFGFAVPIPLWNFGREAVAHARAASALSAARAAETRLATNAAVASARIRLTEAAARAHIARDSLRAEAARVRAGAVRLYEEGRTDVSRVFDALRAEREVGQTVVQALLEFQIARAELLATLGQWE